MNKKVAIADVADSTATLEAIRQSGGEAFAARCDISNPESVADFVSAVGRQFGEPPRILVHSAAVHPPERFRGGPVGRGRI